MTKQSLIVALALLMACGAQPGESTKQKTQDQMVTETVINPQKSINCFIYHRFGDSRYPSTNIPIEDFKAQLNYLTEAGFEVMTFRDAIKYLKDEQPLKKVAVITIDDGFRSFYENGLPLLETHGFPATLFINTETVGGSSYMDWKEIKDASERGIEIGNHTHSHAFFLNMDADERYKSFESEINQCQQLIQENLGTRPKVFAYPYGEFDKRMIEIVKDAGFTAAAAQNSGVISNDSELMACPRFPMATGFSDINEFKLKANALPLKVKGAPERHILSENFEPSLNLIIRKESLRLNELQCFIQGGTCDLSINQKVNDEYEVVARPNKSIEHRRRTLYTLTVQDNTNNWYWYSYLWINPKIKE